MSRKLVIVESPAKAKTMGRMLGSGYSVKASLGHVRDLPRWGLGVDTGHDFNPRYQVPKEKKAVVQELTQAVKRASSVYLATDPDREGEAIAWHLKEAIGGDPARYKRVVFNEITKRAITEAFSEPGVLDMRYVEAQQARRFLDRIVGFMVSPLLWAKVARGLSAGRVQSVAVRLVVEREQEIRAFTPEEFWEVYAQLQSRTASALRCQVVRQDEHSFRPDNKADTDAALAILNNAEFKVLKREDKPTSSKPKAPLITSTLQRAS